MRAQLERDEQLRTDLVVRDLSVSYGTQRALADVSIDVPGGARVAVLGANGSGKSTLLNGIAGLVRPSAGSISFGKQRLDGSAAYEVARKGLCFVPEGRGVFPDLTVAENLGISIGKEGPGWDTVFSHFPALKTRLRRHAGTMSGGEQQMLAVAPAVVGSYRLLLIDELSLGLAPLVVDQIYEALLDSQRADTSMLVVEQFADRALALADTAYVLRKGRVVFDGPADALTEDPEALHALYLGGSSG